jgi:uncharacterized protein
MMMTEKLFPSGIAEGKAFCNRHVERQKLKENILANEHTVLVSPRRYGKTSLALKVINDNQFPSCAIDLLLATNHHFVKNAILSGVGSVLNQILPKHKRIQQKILSLFSSLNPKLVLTAFGQKVELYAQLSPKKSIVDALINLDEIAGIVDERVVVLIDEFQQIGMLDDNKSLEASIRHAAERSKHTTYLFSGSDRHLLDQMFSERGRPLYHLCDLLRLGRIHAEDYVNFLQIAAKKQWNSTIKDEAINEMLDCTGCHAYYVNVLCKKLWKLKTIPTISNIKKVWNNYIIEQYQWIMHDLSELSVNQKLVLAGIAYEPISEPQSQKFTKRIGLTSSNIKRALDNLLRKDFVYFDDDKFYKVLDPAILNHLRSIPFFNFDID